MSENSTDDSNDSDYPTSKAKSHWAEAHKQENSYDEKWPNTLQTENCKCSEKLPEPCVENILKMLKNSTRAKSTQNGDTRNNTTDHIANICFDKKELEKIIGLFQQPKVQTVTPQISLPPPTLLQFNHPPPRPPPPPMPQHQPVQHSNIMPSIIPHAYQQSVRPSYHYPMNGVPMEQIQPRPILCVDPNIAPYINASQNQSIIPTQFTPDHSMGMNGNSNFWSHSAGYCGAPRPFTANAMPTPPQSHSYHHQNNSGRIDPRLQPRPELSQRTHSSHIHDAPTDRRSQWDTPNRASEPAPAKQRISYAEYKKKNKAVGQNENNTLNNSDVTNDMQSKPNDTEKNDVVYDEPTFSPTPTFSSNMSVSNPNSPASLTPPPSITPPLSNQAESSDRFNDFNGHNDEHMDNMPMNSREIKQENPQNGFESDESTNSFDSNATQEFTIDAYRKECEAINASRTNGSSPIIDGEHGQEKLSMETERDERSNDTDEIENALKEIDEYDSDVTILYDDHLDVEENKTDLTKPKENMTKNNETETCGADSQNTSALDVKQFGERDDAGAEDEFLSAKSIENTMTCSIYLGDIRDNVEFEKYFQKAAETVQNNVTEDTSPLALSDSDEDIDEDKDDYKAPVIEISSDSD